ncbi:hypothetical protein HYR99_38120 [Candidatus Poribacteria bacterium]|nr:hypothetical protein [Candidatus Poribacteria bacterium]
MTQKSGFRWVWMSVVLGIMISNPLWATKEGAGDPWAFMTIGTGARAMGFGGAFVAIADDATATYWNPAGLGFIKGHEVMFMHIEASEKGSDSTADGIAGRHEYGSAAFQLPWNHRVGGSWNYFSIDGIQYTVADPEKEFDLIGEANQQDTEQAYILSYAVPVAFPIDEEWFSLGANLRYMRQQLIGISTGGVGVDGGFLIKLGNRLGVKNWRSGYVFQWNRKRSWPANQTVDLGNYIVESPGKLDPETMEPPPGATEPSLTSWRWGVAFDPMDNEQVTWTMALAVVNRRKGSPPVLSVGTEVWLLNKIIALRAGIDDWRIYRRDAETETHIRPTLGFGVGVSFLQLDYAASFESLAVKSRISLTLRQPVE